MTNKFWVWWDRLFVIYFTLCLLWAIVFGVTINDELRHNQKFYDAFVCNVKNYNYKECNQNLLNLTKQSEWLISGIMIYMLLLLCYDIYNSEDAKKELRGWNDKIIKFLGNDDKGLKEDDDIFENNKK